MRVNFVVHDEPFPVAGDAYLQRRTLRRLPGVMNKIAAGLRLQRQRNAFLFNAQQDIAPLFAAFVSDGNDDGGGDYATLHVPPFARKGVIRWRPHCVGLHSRGYCRARQPAGSAPARR